MARLSKRSVAVQVKPAEAGETVLVPGGQPLFRVMGALSTEAGLAISWLAGVVWWLFTADWSVCVWAKKLLAHGACSPTAQRRAC